MINITSFTIANCKMVVRNTMYTGNLNYYSIVFSTKRFPQKGGNHAIMYFSLFIYFIDIYSKTMASGNSPRDIGSLKIKPLHDLEI